MKLIADKKPIYDDRVNDILRGLVDGLTREELAERMGYKNYKTLDIYMRRKNFKWDREKLTYVPAYGRFEKQEFDTAPLGSSKVATVISLFQKEGSDAKTIAKRMGFADHRELAAYMKTKGYRWSSELGNYQKVYGELPGENMDTYVGGQEEGNESTAPTPVSSTRAGPASGSEDLERFLPLLEMLERNRDRLVDLIVPGSTSGRVPRYAVPGVFITKSVHMANTLDQLVREYSKEKNISQRDIFTVALIEFFCRYGYEREVELLLGRM
ncbi:hypothetical protein ACI7RC_03945 [Brevibacillus sp. B_LB10_24]|uniref:hypothetical protein n=1 Tax=Brevibacillus sp. B_LB10_24 TaxID=3380645 RepID=UPI0038BB4090